MDDADKFARTLLEEAKRFLEKANVDAEDGGRQAYLHAALNLGFCALEAHINAVANEIAAHKEFSAPHDQGVLLEKEVRLDKGLFKLTGLRIYPLTDRISFIYRRIKGKPLDSSAQWWSDLAIATELRNRLTHPKDRPSIKFKDVKNALVATVKATDVLYRAVYNKPFPPAGRGLNSKLNF